MPEVASYPTTFANQDLWLAAGGVGLVHILDPARLRTAINIPDYILPVAYDCSGYLDPCAIKPEFKGSAWEARVPLETAIHYDLHGGDERS